MASAAAVAADIARSPVPEQEVNDELDTVGGITQADHFRSKDSESDENEDIALPGRRRQLANGIASHVREAGGEEEEEEEEDDDDEDDAALFGSGSEGDASPTQRRLDDEDLDSGDDEDRDDRRMEDEEAQEEQATKVMFSGMDLDIGRAPIPEPSDGELYLLKIPPFFGIEPVQFKTSTFKLPTTDHHSKTDPSSTFSAYKTAMTTVRWRRSPSDPSRLQSNTRVVRWSDGSLTLQFASDPTTHYPITANALAPAQLDPQIPTPVSKLGGRRGRQSYNPEQDTFTYLAAPQEMAGMLRVTNKLTAALKVQSATDASAEALERLQNSLAAATNGQEDAVNGVSGISMVRITEDPELAKRRMEVAEKEKMKAQKRRDAQEMRDRERHGRVMGRRSMGMGLTVGGLEDEDEVGMGVTRLPGVGSQRKKGSRSNRRGEIYSDDESDFAGRGRTKEDEYDAEDDFLAPSDEEEEVADDESESDAVEDRRPSKSSPTARRDRTPKRSLDDAEGDVDEEPAVSRPPAGSPPGRNKRRRVIEEDDDDE